MKQYPNTTIPLEAQYMYRRGMELIDQEKTEIGLVYLRQAIFIAPGFSKAYRELGMCLARLGRGEEASKALEKASRLEQAYCDIAVDKPSRIQQVEETPVPGDFLTFLIW